MLLCRTCGQCVLIDPDLENGDFYAYEQIRGWQRTILNPDTGEIIDYGEVEDHESTGETEEATCPYCEDGNIDWDWHGTEVEARTIREAYASSVKRDNDILNKDPEWDEDNNE